jgi:ABC-type branched-subunit amino acid transport system substrate-binding protein
MYRGHIRRSVRWGAVAALGALVVAGCGSSGKTAASTATTAGGAASASTTVAPVKGSGASDTTGVTASTITIGQIATVTGPVPGLFENAEDSLDAYVAYINSVGGVDGRKLKLDFKDDALNCNTYTNDIQGLSSSSFAIVGTFSIIDSCGQKVLDNNPNFPDIQGYLFSPQLYTTRNALSPSPQPPGYSTTAAEWLKNKFPSAITHTAALYSLTSKTSFNSISSSFKATGYKYVYTRGVGLTETNFTSDVLRMKAAGIQIVDLTGTDVQDAANFILEADQQNYHPDAIFTASAYDGNLFKLLGSANASNLYMPLLYPLYLGEDSSVNPELATYLKWLNITHPGTSANIYGIEAWASGVLFTQALKAAGGSPSRSALINQVNKITSFTANGLLPSTNPAAKQGAVCIVMVGVKGQKFVRLDPSTSGFECNGTYNHITAAQASA